MSKKKKKRKVIDNFIWSVAEIFRFKKAYLLVLIMNSVVKGISPVVTLVIFQRMIDVIQFQSGTLQDAGILLASVAVVQLISECLLLFTGVKLSNYELAFDLHFQEQILKKVSTLSCKDFENNRTYDLVNRTQYDADAGILGSIKTFFSLAASLISSVSFAVIIAKFNIILFIIIIVIPVVRYIFEKRYNLKEYEVEKENTEPNRRAGYISYLLTNSEDYKEIKTFGLFRFFIKQYGLIRDACNLKQILLNNKRGRVFGVLTVLERVSDFAVTLWILIHTFSGTISIGRFLLYNNSIDNLKDNLVSIFSQLSFLYKNSAMIELIRDFFELEPEDTNEDGIVVDKINSIKIEGVSYRYQGKKEYALKEINLEIKPGELTIFMGNNGSGKTTLMKIIMGVYNDYTGNVLINGHNLRELNMTHYRSKVSVLFQNYIKYESSIEDNIRYGNVNIAKQSKYIKNIMRRVKLGEYTDQLSQMLGYQFQEGTQMSIGQWQKMALGRTLYRDADIYIFDEPNASLDLLTESEILKTIRQETKGKITFIIMHRFNTMVVHANNITVLENGKIAESGTHSQLINKQGIYAALFNQYHNIDELSV